MLKKISFILIGIISSLGILPAISMEYPDSTSFTLGFSTYLSHTDKYASGFDIYTDSAGYTYVSGNTRDKNFPATDGAYQAELKGSADVFVVKYSPEGEIVFATLIGGTKREHHSAITVDEAGFIYVAGGTHSSDFPVTSGSYDTSFNGEGTWAGDVFLTKLNPSGTEIIFSTFIGGEIEETVGTEGIKLDSKGNIILVGTTRSHDFPLTRGVIDKEVTNMHGFLTKFSPDGEKLLFSTYFGSSILDGISALTLDDKDNIYIMGGTFTADLAVTDNAVRKEMILSTTQGEMDHYIAKIDATDNEIVYLSYFAGRGWPISSMKWTKPNKLMVCSSSMEEGMPVSDSVIENKGDGVQNCFISIFNSNDMTLTYSAQIGGSDDDKIMNAHFLNQDTIVIGGMTNSSDFPLSENALYSGYPASEKTFNNTFPGRRKSFISVIDIKNSKLLYSTYFGSCFLFYIHPDANGNISFVAESGQKSQAGMTGFPISKNAIEPPSFTIAGRLLLNAKPEPKKVIVAVPVEDAILESYVGEYELTPGFTLTITKHDSQLKVQATGQGTGSIIPIAPNVFVIKGVEDALLTFNLTETGEIESMTLNQHGMDNVCKKL